MKRRILWTMVLAIQLVATLVVDAQIEVRAKLEGEWLPVVDCDKEDAFVMKEGRRKRVGREDIQVHPAAAFGTGMAEIENVKVDLDPMRDAPAKERSKPGSLAFRYTADVSSAVKLEDCYALLVFVANGSVGTNLLPLGTLAPGKSRSVKVELTTQVDAVAHLHVFSGTSEICSNQVPSTYSARDYWDELARSSKGVSAVELCKSEERYPMALSRDGQMLALVRDRGTHFSILIYDLASMKILCEVPADKKYKRVTDPTWISAREVAFILDEEKLMLMDIDKAACVTLRENVGRILFGLQDKPETLVLVCQSGGWAATSLYDVRTRKVVSKETLSNGWTTFDKKGRARLRYEYDDNMRKQYCRLPGSDRWVQLDSTVKEPGLKFSLRGEDVLDEVADVIGAGADDESIYIADRCGSDTFQLAIYNPVKGVITQTIAKHPKYDLWLRSDDSQLLLDPATREPVGTIYEGEKPRVVWWDANCATVQRALETNFPARKVVPIVWSADYATFIYYVGSDQDPGAYYAFRPREAKLIPMFKIAPALEGRRLAKTTPLDFPARDGATIHGYLTLPPEAGAGPLPLVVWVHGGPAVRDCWEFNTVNQFLATRGYAVLQVNYRGSTGYGAAYQKVGMQARLDTVVLDDIADGVQQLIKAGTVDPKRVAVGGGSFGGWATYMSLIKYPELYRAGVAIAAVSHLRQQQRDNLGRFGNYYGYAVWKTLLGRSDFSANERFIDPLLRASEIKQPVYIMHGEWDRVVHPTQAREMLKALQKTNPNVESMSFPDAGHSYWPFHDRVTQLNEIEAFLRRHLAPAAALPPVDAKAGLTP